MSFQQFTTCIPPSEHIPLNRLVVFIGQGILVGITAVAIAIASGNLQCWPIVLEITAVATVVAYCRGWLFHRLLCLGPGEDQDCIGMIASISPPSPALFDFDWDTDYSVNLLLKNCPIGVTQEVAKVTSPFGFLVHEQDSVTAVGLATAGHTVPETATGLPTAVLHAEFEGAGNHDLLLGAEAALGLAVAALIACMALPYPWGLVLALLALLALVVAALFGNGDLGSPSDVGTGNFHTNEIDPASGEALGADILYVQGSWVFDPLHEGWNEIHPIKVCTKVGCWNGDWFNTECHGGTTPPDIILRLRNGFRVARAPETLANQALPEHQWRLHPDLDGCARPVIL
jgi:hypothetical protein